VSSISDRLKSMRADPSATAHQTAPASIPSRFPIETVVPGVEISTIFGPAYTISKQFDDTYRHGWYDLKSFPDLTLLAEWGRLPHLVETRPEDIVFLDTETTGLVGGTGTIVFLVGLGYHTPAGFQVDQLYLRDPAEEPAFLAALDRWLSRFQTIVTFNGKSFDIPLINTRYTLNAITSPAPQKQHLDLLHLARRLWRDRLPSRALGDLEKEIVGFYRGDDEVPGYLIPQYYFDYLRTADARPMSGVIYHNMVDIITLAVLFNFIGSLLANPSQTDIHTLDLAAIARLYEELGHLEEAAEMYERCIAQGLPEEQFFKTIERFATMRRKQGRADLAAGLWMHAVERNHIPALIELAKYYEHQTGELVESMGCVNKAITLLASSRLPSFQRKFLLDELTRRLARLEKKLGRQAAT